MRALVVDDERLARARLCKLLEAHPEVTVVAQADSVDSAEVAISAHAPDLIFLDVAMPGGSGFDLLGRVRVDANVVFVTAHDEHAIRAFEVGAIDYLLKPIEPARLAESIRRLRARAVPPEDRICLGSEGTLRVVPVGDIMLVRADGDYTEVLLRDGNRVVQKAPLTGWERRLGAAFARVHRGTLVAIAYVERVERAEGSTYRLFLRGRSEAVAVSRSHAAALKATLRGP